MTQRFTNVSGLPLALAAYMAADDYDYNPDPFTISATTLMKPLRQIILARRVPESAELPDIMDRVANRLGSAIHGGIEDVWKDQVRRTNSLLALGIPAAVAGRVVVNPHEEYLAAHPEAIPVYMEQRERRQVGKWTVTGKYDFVAEGQVQDFKTANVLSYQKQRNADKQILQGSLYRWLNPKKITKDEMIIMHIFMDWMRGMAKVDKNYPQHRCMKQVLTLKSLAETENFVRQKLALIEQYIDAPEEEIPQCSDEELWRSDPVFKYYKNGAANQKRSTKNFDNRTDAYTYFVTEVNSVGELKEVPGLVKACNYCQAYDACKQKDGLLASGDLAPND